MATTYTAHVVCDVCGKRADVEVQHPNQDHVPEGWRRYKLGMWGIFCSHACARSWAVADAMKAADLLFEPDKVETVA